MKPKLTNDDFCRATKKLRCGVAEIKAVAEVESKGDGFYDSGFPVILFERHKFRKYTGGAYNHTHPHLSGPAGNYGKPGQNQINKFNEAFKLDPDAAMLSCSWGKFQIMGFNHKICGFGTVGAFVDAMKESEGRQLDAFVNFVIHEHLADELRRHDWEGFAAGYNGSEFKKNKYDTKMADAYDKHSKERVDCSNISAAPPVSSEQEGSASVPTDTANPAADSIVETKTTEVVQTGDTTHAVETTQPKGDPPDADPTKVSTGGPLARWLFSGGVLTSLATSVWAFVTANGNVIAIAVVCITVLIIVLIFRGAITDAIRMQTAADPDKKNVT